jgi:hypothetical protein
MLLLPHSFPVNVLNPIEARQLHTSPAEATTVTDLDSFHQIPDKSYTNYLLQLFCYVKLAN